LDYAIYPGIPKKVLWYPNLYSSDFSTTDIMGILEDAGIAKNDHIYAFSISSYGCLYWRESKEQVSRAKMCLLNHRALNPETGMQVYMNVLGGSWIDWI
jgi:hypothetical protein